MILLTYGASFTILWGFDAAVEATEGVIIINLKFYKYFIKLNHIKKISYKLFLKDRKI